MEKCPQLKGLQPGGTGPERSLKWTWRGQRTFNKIQRRNVESKKAEWKCAILGGQQAKAELPRCQNGETAGSRESEPTGGMAWGFKSSEPTLGDTLPPGKPHLLNLLKQCHTLGTKYSNVRD